MSCRFNFPVSVWLMSKFKSDQSTCPPGNMTMISVLYNILLIIGDPILLGRLKLGDDVLDLSGVDAKYSGFRVDGEFILNSANEC